ncbi:MAG TPA: L-glutamate gamma-semialdehyde dehydrogenase, partial [Candidatus Polarisedimenticolia bacterium]|nr:L-glutamate gamma-semialdehyde dehydrogenase [Candidatus Polarisedimenticolia bacterium]
DLAIAAAERAFESWGRERAEKRADFLFRTAAILRDRKHEFSAWMVLEVGKSWVEADADTAEAIDFCEFYAGEALRYASEQPLVRIPAEKNELRYIPLGVGVVVPPWNFPLAIMAGMTVAAAVTGNTVVLKPSSDAPGIAARFVSALEEAGMPAGVVNFLTGGCATIGDHLVASPRVRFVVFTGSKAVGLRINELAAHPRPGQIWIKRVVAEMGGKDFIIVDDTADREAAAAGIVASAFGFQGQKCSACSRAIVLQSVYDEVLKKIVEKTQALKLGPTTSPEINVGPVINSGAEKKILEYVETGKREGRLVAGGEKGPGEGYFVRPTVIADVKPDSTIAQEEIFGPVLAVIPARDYETAVRIANGTEYGLTGSLYSKDPRRLDQAKGVLHVGNLYLNRKCTGALVGVHPFGGFNMSGTDSKAGGRDYLLLFLQAKAISQAV